MHSRQTLGCGGHFCPMCEYAQIPIPILVRMLCVIHGFMGMTMPAMRVEHCRHMLMLKLKLQTTPLSDSRHESVLRGYRR